MRTSLRPFVLHTAIYLVFGGAVFAFAALQRPRGLAFGVVVGVAAVAGVWSGVLTGLVESRVYPIARALPRFAWGVGLGAVSLGGFAAALSFVTTGNWLSAFVAVGAVAGGLMQGARAFTLGMKPLTDDAPSDDDGSDASGAP